MTIDFYKFDGAGNDFVVFDNRTLKVNLTTSEVARICHRRFGVGSDGMMTLDMGSDDCMFEMHYYNSDGRLGSMCGNGGRCISAFAHMLGMGDKLRFRGFDGFHESEILAWDEEHKTGMVRLGMRDVERGSVRRVLDGWFLDTGSPHYVQTVIGLDDFDVVGEGRRIRNMNDVFPEGTNVDFVEERADGCLAVRTYERGVEDETYACGTGVTACSIVTGIHSLKAVGGNFMVDFDVDEDIYRNVKLTGPVSLNFTGKWTCSAR